MKRQIKIIWIASSLTLLAMTGDLMAAPAPCTKSVTIADGNSSRSLPGIAATGCSPITFDQSITTVTVPYPVTIKEGVTLDGGGHAIITPATSFTQPSAATI